MTRIKAPRKRGLSVLCIGSKHIIKDTKVLLHRKFSSYHRTLFRKYAVIVTIKTKCEYSKKKKTVPPPQKTHSSKKVTSPSPQSSNSSATVPSNCALASSSSTGCGVGVGGAGVSRSALDGVPGESPKRHRLFRGVSGAVAIGRGSVSGDSAFAGE